MRTHGGRGDCSAGLDEWVVLDRYCNHSAFNGYHETPSDYSAVKCLRCLHWWRTKANYVRQLRDATQDERFA
jgi:hypothetical protein